MPKPSGRTAYVNVCTRLQPHVQNCDVIFVGDGGENCQQEPVTIHKRDGTVGCLDFSAVSGDDYLALVASFITHVCGHKIFLVGIGSDARSMANSLVTRSNCHVALVYPGASTREIAGVVRAVRNAPARRQAIGQATDNSEIIVNISPQAQDIINRLTEAEVKAVAATGNSIVVLAETTLPPPISAAEIEAKFKAAEKDFTEPNYNAKKVRAAALFSLAGMIDGKLPAACFFGARWGQIDVNSNMKKILNVLFSKLEKQGLLQKMGNTPAKSEDGAPLLVDGVKVPEKAVIYRCVAGIKELEVCMKNAEFADSQESISLKKRRRSEEASASGSGASSP